MAKAVARRLLPHRWRDGLRARLDQFTWPLYIGRGVRCNCCDGRFRRFRLWIDEQGFRWMMCPRCGSLGRHRVDWIFLTEYTNLRGTPQQVLHVAPERCLERALRRLPNVDYLSADLDSIRAMERMDITHIPHPEGSFDVIICNHVLEHVPDDRRAMREMLRVLRPGGWAMLQVPFDRARAVTFEDATVTEPGERLRVFGQHDHVRVYGRDYPERLREAGFAVEVASPVRALPQEVVRRLELDPEEDIFVCRKLAPPDGQG